MKRSALLLSLLFSVAAEAQIYEYKDAAGRTVYSDQPPPITSKAKSRTVSSEAAAPASAEKPATPAQAKSAADRDMEFNKRQKERQDQAAKEQKEQAAAAERKEACSNAQRQLQALESGVRIGVVDEKGERSFIDDEQRAREIQRTRKMAAENCVK